MRVLVTGGSGFLGRHTIPRLLAGGHDVVALARSEQASATVVGLGASAVAGDLDDAPSVDRAFAGSDAVALVNLASLGFGHAPTIVAAAERAGLKRAVFVSTTAIFTSLNAPSKAVRTAAEQAVTGSALDWTIVRPTMIYGDPGDRNMARLLRVLRRWPVVPVPGGGKRLQQPVHVDDLSDAIVHALESAAAVGKAYDVAGPEAIPFRQVLADAGAAVGRAPRLLPIPIRPAIALLRAYERVAAAPRLKAEQLERLAEDKAFDISEARADLGYAPRAFAVGIAEEADLLR
jgi:nucleoside-diphosphate-sugar epimerase